AAWKKSGEWRVISDKLVLFLKEDNLPSFIFMTGQHPYIFDPWAKTMMSELKTSPPVNSRIDGFPIIPANPNANPTNRSPVTVRIPTAIRVVRHGESLTISFPSLQTTNLMIGQ